LYYDNEKESEITNPLRKYFRLSNVNASSPILHPYSIQYLTEGSGNQLIIINENQKSTLAKLKEIYPEISAVNFENKPLNLSFFDKKGNAVIILMVNNKTEFETLIEQMNHGKHFDKTKIKQN
jgi:rRNA maturation protein Rpf1